MEADKRYQTTVDIPESLLRGVSAEDNPFSIQGKFREGRAAYLDMAATTPLDPRVFDVMAPYMVRTYTYRNSPIHTRIHMHTQTAFVPF